MSDKSYKTVKILTIFLFVSTVLLTISGDFKTATIGFLLTIFNFAKIKKERYDDKTKIVSIGYNLSGTLISIYVIFNLIKYIF